MKWLSSIALIIFAATFPLPVVAQKSWEIESDPTAFVLRGYSVHVARAFPSQRFRVQVGSFKAQTPEWIHGNQGFTETSLGATGKVDFWLLPNLAGLFVGVDSNFSRVHYKLDRTGEQQSRNIIALGPRVGYRFNIGDHLYITPWVSMDDQFNSRNVTISGEQFREMRWSVFPAVHVGWSFRSGMTVKGKSR